MILLYRFGLFLTITLACTVVVASAQTVSPTPSTPPDRMTTITVTGCVQRNTTPEAASRRDTVGTSGVTPAAPFILIHPKSTAAEEPTAKAKEIVSAATGYQLVGRNDELEQAVGRGVEITGTVDQADKGVVDAANGAAGVAPLPTLSVTSLKEAAADCSK